MTFVSIERAIKSAIAILSLLLIALWAVGHSVWANDPPPPGDSSEIAIKASQLAPPPPTPLIATKPQTDFADPALALVVDKLEQMGQPSGLKTKHSGKKISLSRGDNPTPPQSLAQAWAALQSGDALAALHTVDRVLLETPNAPDALNLKAYILSSMDRHEAAVETLCHLLEIAPHNAEALRNLAIELGQSTAPHALKELEDMASADPSNAIVQASLARQYARRQDETKALASMDRAMSLAPQNIGYRIEMGGIYDRYGYPSEAAALYRQAYETASARRETGELGPAITQDLLRVVLNRADYLERHVLRAPQDAASLPMPEAPLAEEKRQK